MACTSWEHICTCHVTKAPVTLMFVYFQKVGNKMPSPAQALSKQIPIYLHIRFKQTKVKISCCSKVGKKNLTSVQHLISKGKFWGNTGTTIKPKSQQCERCCDNPCSCGSDSSSNHPQQSFHYCTAFTPSVEVSHCHHKCNTLAH